jgi:hypothetical protein
LQVFKRPYFLVSLGDCNGTIEDVFVDFLGRQLFGEQSIVLFEFLFDLPFFGYFIAIFLNPFGDFGTATDALVGDHFDGELNDFDTGLLDDKEELGFVFGGESVLFVALLNTDDLGDHVGIIFGVVAFITNKASLDEVIELAIVQELDEPFSGEGDLLDELAEYLNVEMVFMGLSLFAFGLGFVDLAWFLALGVDVLFWVVVGIIFVVASLEHFAATFAFLVFVVELMDAFDFFDLTAMRLPDLANLVLDLLVDFVVFRVAFFVGMTFFPSFLHSLSGF